MTRIQIAAARALLRMERKALANEAGVSVGALQRIELGQSDPKASTLNAIKRTLEKAGVEFLGDDGVRLRPKP
jgi:predicted transcriptional regulator